MGQCRGTCDRRGEALLQPPQVVVHLARGLVSARRVLAQRPREHRVQEVEVAGRDVGDRLRVAGEDGAPDQAVVAAEGTLAGQHLVEEDPERPEVAPVVHVVATSCSGDM